MTTLLADAKAGVIVADSNMTEGDRIWSVRKIVRAKGMLLAGAGEMADYAPAIEWFKEHGLGLDHPTETPPSIAAGAVLILAPSGLWLYDVNAPVPQRAPSGYEAIGTGAVAALAAYRGINKRTPEAARRAVRIACALDAGSRPPVRMCRL